MGRVPAELGVGRSSHGREQREHRPASAGWANNCPGATSSVAGSANHPAPTPRPSDSGGLICMAQAQGPGPGSVYREGQGCGRTVNTTPSAALAFVDIYRVLKTF